MTELVIFKPQDLNLWSSPAFMLVTLNVNQWCDILKNQNTKG